MCPCCTPMAQEVRFSETSVLGCHSPAYYMKFDKITQLGISSCLSFMEYLNEWAVEDSRYQGLTCNIPRTNSVCTGHSLRRNCLVKYVTVGKIGEIEWEGGRGRRSKLLTLRKREDTGNWKRKH